MLKKFVSSPIFVEVLSSRNAPGLSACLPALRSAGLAYYGRQV